VRRREHAAAIPASHKRAGGSKCRLAADGGGDQIYIVKTVSLEQAATELPRLCERAAAGETVVIQSNHLRIALQPIAGADPLIAPPGYFSDDYSSDEIRQLNEIAARGPQGLLP
jgi:hypothetical protein